MLASLILSSRSDSAKHQILTHELASSALVVAGIEIGELRVRIELLPDEPALFVEGAGGDALRAVGVVLDPGKLRGCIDTGGRLEDQHIARELTRVAGEIRALDEERRRLIGGYATEQIAGEAYIAANRALDTELDRLTREKAELVAALRSSQHEDFVDASIRHFFASARARFQACADFDAKREFLLGHVERVIYNRYKVTIVGSVPVQSASGETKLPFRIEGEIDREGGALTAENDVSGRWAVESSAGA